MIPQSSKFPLRTEFLEFRKKAKQLTTPHTRLLYNTKLPEFDTRLAVIVPKKVSKLATTRNFFKRLTYDLVYPLIKDKNIDCVIIYKPLALKKDTKTKQDLVHELTQIIANI